MTWPHRRFLAVTAEKVDEANALYAQFIDTDGEGQYTFSVPLSANNPQRVTHYGADTSMTTAQWALFLTTFAALITSGDVTWIDSGSGRAAVKSELARMGKTETDEARGKYRSGR